MGASDAVLKQGYNLDCLMLRYQGIDWRDYSNWNCNGGWAPGQLAPIFGMIWMKTVSILRLHACL